MGRLGAGFRVSYTCALGGWLLLVLLLLGFSPGVRGQSDGVMHHYMFNQLDFNPGYAGSQGQISVYALARQQWLGFGPGAPQTIFLNFDMPFSYRKLSQMAPGRKMQYSHGLGMHLFRDAVGYMSTNAIELSYGGRFHLRGVGSLAVGLGVCALNDRFDAKWRTPDAGADQDVAIPDGKASGITLDVSFGLYYNTTSMYFSVSAKNLLGAGLRNRLTSGFGAKGRLDHARQYYVSSGYNLALKGRWSLLPSVIARTDLSQYQLGVTLLADYNDVFWFGVSNHVMESAGVLLGANLFQGLRIGYSYDYPMTGMRQFTTGSHEVLVGYTFSLQRERKPERYKSVRYL